MSHAIYDAAHVTISRLVGRKYNNPLGEAAFPLLQRLLQITGRPRVLDVGCGRGATALWWARHASAVVTGLDPSPAMLDEARRAAEDAGLAERVTWQASDLPGFVAARRTDDRFDLVILHDVLCYVADKRRHLELIRDVLASSGLVSLSDYHAEADRPEVRAIVGAWGIHVPLTFDGFRAMVVEVGFAPLLLMDTTRQYRDHWRDIGARVATQRAALEAVVDPQAVEQFAGQVAAILSAVATGGFGHMWTVLAAR